MSTKTRFQVRDIGPGITRTIRERYQVVDAETSTIVDEYSSKKAASDDAKARNRAPAETK
jgi:hypothetical protein